MGSLIGFFAGGPARIQALLIAALAMALVCAALLVYGLWWRGEAKGAQLQLTAALAQGAVLADGLKTCNTGADQAKRAGDAAIATTTAMLAEARRLHVGGRLQAERIETLLAKPTPPGAGCTEAWAEIERLRSAGATR